MIKTFYTIKATASVLLLMLLPFYGITAKTESDFYYNRYNFLQCNTVIHDNYIHHTDTEGMYIGSSFYDGQHFICNGHDTSMLPPLYNCDS